MLRKQLLTVAARSSPLSKIQVKEVLRELNRYYPLITFDTTFIETTGDRDKKTSLRSLDKTNFFTKEIDEYQVDHHCQISIHSAKDLPEPLHKKKELPSPEGEGLPLLYNLEGVFNPPPKNNDLNYPALKDRVLPLDKDLTIAAVTKGVDPSDVLVLRSGETITDLPKNAIIATSSKRREEAVKNLQSDLKFVDLRGNIQERLSKLNNGEADGIVVAKAALIRLNLNHLNQIKLPGKTANNQGKLAIITHKNDVDMQNLFAALDSRKERKKTLYFGLDTSNYKSENIIFHYPIIKIVPKKVNFPNLADFTHIIFTSKSAVKIFCEKFPQISPKIIAIGRATTKLVKSFGLNVYLTAKNETSESIVEELTKLNLSNANILWPHSLKSRNIISSFLKENNIKHQEIELYDTITKKENFKPNLKSFDRLVFTSPSTINSFIEVFGSIPHNKEIETIGPITQKHLDFISS